jgi:serine/threonine-protein kinase
MGSIFQGFEYDIFISYRQKDNKHDGWVTEFVNQLKGELESTFKEEISVYFDINPHDGLLETHDVDASLKEKLKCIIFIPVISRTYCDPKAFAWEHEFIAFIEQASHDQFGLKVKLPNGNVASRVLPVRIHDLDATDIRLCESALGGVIRSVDFVYKEPGVNRPLTTDDDEKKNLNGTKYKNQINKTANAIKEIISGLKSEPDTISKDKVRQPESWDEGNTDIKQKESTGKKIFSQRSIKWLIMLFIVILCALGANAVYHKLNLAKTSKSIAVYILPGINDDNELNNISDIYTETINKKLRSIKNLTVKSVITWFQILDTKENLSTFREELNVSYLLDGKIERNGNEIVLLIKLTSKKDNKLLWNDIYVWDKNLISQNATAIVREIARRIKIKLSPDELKDIETELSKNAEANLDYLQGNTISFKAWSSLTMATKYVKSVSFKTAIEAYDKAIKEDSLFAGAYAKRAIARSWGYATGQLDSTHIKKCLEDIIKASKINKDLNDIQIALGFYFYYCKEDLDKALLFFAIASEKSPEDYQPLFYMSLVYRRKGEWTESMNLVKRIIALDPLDALCLTNIGATYTYLHNYDSAMIFHQKAIDIMPVWSSPYKNMIETLILKEGNTLKARTVMETGIEKTGRNFTEYKILFDIYDRNYSDALQNAKKSLPDEYYIEGKKQLYIAQISSLMNNMKDARLYYDSALVILNKSLISNQDISLKHSNIGIANAGLGNKEDAIAEGTKAVDLIQYNNFDKGDMIVNLAKIFTMTGEYDQAISTLDYLLITPLNNPCFFSIKLLQLDPIWMPLFDQPDFKILLRKYSIY